MGIRLDWQIEAERAYERASEDPGEKRRRRVQRTRILLFTAGVVLSVCAVAAAVWYRLYTVDNQLRQDLIDTVQAETAALRIGDFGAYLALQRTAPNGTWLQEQSDRFKRYQDLKTKSDLKLTGNVIDTTIDRSRGRALIEEVIDGVTYHTVWYYWRYADGWRHVPSDYTFWGNPQTITGKVSTLKYNGLDTPLAQILAPRVERWWSQGCGYVGCPDVPQLTVQVVAEPIGQVRWNDDDSNTLIVPSPLAAGDRLRADEALPQTTEDAVATQLATRIFDIATGNLRPTPGTDADWLRQMVVEWLSGTFTGRGDPNRLSFVQSLEDHYGQPALTAVVRELSPNSDISVLGTALKQPLEALALDWRMFFQWRLDVEKTLLSRNDRATFQSLWDAANPQALAQMRQRMLQPGQPTPQVQAVAIAAGSDGVARAMVQVVVNNKPEIIVFRLVNGAWKRST